MDDKHDKFVDRLLGSRDAVFRVAQWLSEGGFDVQIPAIKVAGKGDDPADFYDDGDLFRRKDGSDWERVEVKGSGVEFEDKHIWPYKNMIVSNKAAVDRGAHNVVAYIILSANWEWVAVIRADTKPYWTVSNIYASNTEKREDFYLCPTDKVIFRKIKDRGSK